MFFNTTLHQSISESFGVRQPIIETFILDELYTQTFVNLG
jgi:hypothetical protein